MDAVMNAAFSALPCGARGCPIFLEAYYPNDQRQGYDVVCSDRLNLLHYYAKFGFEVIVPTAGIHLGWFHQQNLVLVLVHHHLLLLLLLLLAAANHLLLLCELWLPLQRFAAVATAAS
jgi:hypothetical protein